MQCQRTLFDLPNDLHYLNCAYMSPQLRSVTDAGLKSVRQKSDPSVITADDFFDHLEAPKRIFGQLINADSRQIALVPSVSYALANALQNIPARPDQHAIIVEEEFPSDYFAVQRWAEKHRAEIRCIEAPGSVVKRARAWNVRILEAISEQTALVTISSVHWMDGSRFDLRAIGAACRRVGAKLVVDGTQSVGALPIDVQEDHIDVLICAAYKWLMGPYSTGLAYYHPDFDHGQPIEESWANRINARNFSQLSNYAKEYFPGAARYNVGETANFILVPMLTTALQQIYSWGPGSIQDYCKDLMQPLIELAQEKGWVLEEPAYRCHHLMGLRLPGSISTEVLLAKLRANKVITSVRGNSMRISPNVYNDDSDVKALISVLLRHQVG